MTEEQGDTRTVQPGPAPDAPPRHAPALEQQAAPPDLSPLPERVLAQVSHDLRAPLQAIRSTVNRLEDPACLADAARVRSALAIIDRSTKRMEHLITDLMDTEATRSGRMVLRYGRVRIESLVAEALEALQTASAVKGVRIAVPATSIRDPVRCDEGKVLRVLTNLLGNAVKFAPERGNVWVRAFQSEAATGVEVRDDGPGISDADSASLFEPFRTADRSRSGLGLGLYIARSIVKAHAGDIWIDSAPGKGTCVTFTLPTEGPP